MDWTPDNELVTPNHPHPIQAAAQLGGLLTRRSRRQKVPAAKRLLNFEQIFRPSSPLDFRVHTIGPEQVILARPSAVGIFLQNI
jgi:hypothetical protein